MKSTLLVVVLLPIVFGQLALGAVTVPQMINYQGKLTDASGNPRSGTFAMSFRLYSGASPFWLEDQTVTVTDGLFNVLLGSVAPITSIPDNGICSLQVTVSGEPIVPKIPVASQPYSYAARKANTALNSDSLGHVAADGYVRSVVAVAPLSSTGGQNPTLRLDTVMSGDLSGGYPHPTVAKIQGRSVSPTAPNSNDVLTWNGSSWTPAAGGSGSGYWSLGSSYVYPNSPSGGNSGIQAWTTGQTYNLYAQTNAAGQYGIYGHSGTSPAYGVAGYNSTYGVVGILGYGNRNPGASPKLYPTGVWGSGGTSGDGVCGTCADQMSFGVIGHSTHSLGTGVGGTGTNSDGPYVLSVGSGGAFTAKRMGVFGKAYTNWNYFNMGGGYFEAIDSFDNSSSYAYVGAWSASGYGYRCNGNGSCAGGYDTRDGEKLMVSVETPEAKAEDFGRGRLTGGHARIDLDPLFSDCILATDDFPLDVFIQLRDDCHGVYVKTDARGFDVYELQGGKSNAEFSYRVVACRRSAAKDGRPIRFADGLRRQVSSLHK